MKSCLTAVVLLVLLCTVPLSAQEPVHLTIKSIFRSEQDATITSQNEVSTLFLKPSINFKNLQTVSEITIENFPVSNSQVSNVKLSLAKSLIDKNTQFTVDNKNRINPPVMSRYFGKIIGDINSEVLVTLIDNNMFCRVKHGNGEEFSIAPTSANSSQYTISNNKFNVSHTPVACSSVEPPNIDVSLTNAKDSKVLSSTTLQVDIALDICKEWYLWKFKGDTIRIRDYILSAYSMVSFLYEKEMNVTVHIPWFNIWTTSDPYNSGGTSTDWGGNPSTVLAAMPDYWKNNNLSVKANLVHAVSVGGRGGVGNYDALATDIHAGYKWGAFAAISINGDTKYPLTGTPFVSFDFDVHTIAHEMGHNFNCPHSHSCSWNPPIDTCVVFENNNDGCAASGNKRICTQFTQTSIMSYCREINNWVSNMTFLSKPSELIRTYAEKHLKEVSTDVTKPIPPSLLSPTENKQSVPLSTGFKWLKNDITMNYHFQLSKSDKFDTLAKDTTIIYDTLSLVGLDEATNYYWRVATVNHSGEGEFAAYRQFKSLSSIDFLQPEVATSLESDELDFKNVTVGTTKEMSFYVVAGNVVALPLDSISFFGEVGNFSIKSISKSLPTVLTKYDSAIVTVAFKPTKDDTDVSTILKISFHDKENKPQIKLIDVKGNATLTGVNESSNENGRDLVFSIQPNPLTNIGIARYSLKNIQEIRLSLYNTLGKEVAVLFKGVAESGEHTQTLNTDMLPTGMYQVVLRTNSSMTTLTIAVIK